MSSLNQAFLRAYAKGQGPEPRPASRAPEPVSERIDVVDHPLYAPSHDYASHPETPLPSRPLFAARVASALPSNLPAPPAEPVLAKSAYSSSTTSHYDDAKSNYEAIGPSARVGVAQAAPRPLTRPRVAPLELVPAWEVDCFQWPRGCEVAWDAAHEEFGALGEQLVLVNQHGLKVLGVTSAMPHEGRTTLAMCLARAAAEQGLRVVLLDADLENPQLAPALGIDVRHDWTEVISEALPIDETAVSSVSDRLTLIPLLPGKAGRANLLRLPQFAQFVGQLSAVADLVIVDLPPLDSQSLPTARSGQVSPLDAVLLVRDVRQTTVEQLRETRRRLDASGITSVGVIENFV